MESTPTIVTTMTNMASDVAGQVQQTINAILPALAPVVALGIVALAGVKYIRRFAKA